jgi:hypothetical protein
LSHPPVYGARMNSSLTSPRSRRKTSRSTVADTVQPELSWIHDGVRHRVTLWPDVHFLREESAGEWTENGVGEDAFASAALGVTASQWRRYLEFVPAVERKFLEVFQFSRMAVLQLITRCPTLLPVLQEYPALAAFLTAHVTLRGGDEPRWAEIAAVFEREGIFGVLQWLGLPSSRQTLAILGNIADPELPRRLLEPLRTALWEPEAIWALSHAPRLTDEQLAEACHALAA